MTRSDVADRRGIPAAALSNHDLNRELASLHRTRHDTFVHGSGHALANHDQRSRELELEFLRRFPAREPDPRRLRPVRQPRADRPNRTVRPQ